MNIHIVIKALKKYKKYRKVSGVLYNIIFCANVVACIAEAVTQDWWGCFVCANATIISKLLLSEYEEAKFWQGINEEIFEGLKDVKEMEK